MSSVWTCGTDGKKEEGGVVKRGLIQNDKKA